MDFEKIDTVLGDSLEVGDIISESGNFILIRGVDDNDLEGIEAFGDNLSTGDDWDDIVYPDWSYDLYRSY